MYFGKPEYGARPFYAANQPSADNPELRSYRKRVIKYEKYKETADLFQRKSPRQSLDQR